MTPEPEKGYARYVCATLDLFDIQVILVVGDRDACAKLIDKYRHPSYKGPRIGEGFLLGLGKVDEDSETRNGYRAVTIHVEPGVIVYAPVPIGLDVLVHEISHAADMVLHVVGSDCGELKAYLCQYLFRELTDVRHPEEFFRGDVFPAGAGCVHKPKKGKQDEKER